MVKKAIYLCKSGGPDRSNYFFFLCGHHIEESNEVLKNIKSAPKLTKITDVKNEQCERCLSIQNDERNTAARGRAVELYKWLMATEDRPHPTKDQVPAENLAEEMMQTIKRCFKDVPHAWQDVSRENLVEEIRKLLPDRNQ